MRLRVLLLIAAHMPLLRAEPSRTKEPSSISGRDKVTPTGTLKPTSCGKDCEQSARVRKSSTQAIEHSTPRRSMPGTRPSTPKMSKTQIETRTTKNSTLEIKHSTPQRNMPGAKRSTSKTSTPGIEGRTTKKSTPGTEEEKCELYYFVPTANHTDEAFFFWNNTKVEQLLAYSKITSFLETNRRKAEPLFFPAHIPLVEVHNGSEVLVLKDVYVRAQGACGDRKTGRKGLDYFDTNPDWYKNPDERLKKELEMLENYVQRIPRSHWGYRVPKTGEDDLCLDETGLVVKDFPGIRTCFSMWIFDDRDQKPKHFAGRQIYNRINQTQHVNASKIGFNPSGSLLDAEPIRTEMFSLPALFLQEMCSVKNASSLKNRCTYWTTNRFYVSLCCCYTTRTECAYKNYTFPTQKKVDDPDIRACATGDYYLVQPFGGTPAPRNAEVTQFIRENTSSEFCQWTYTWDVSNKTDVDRVLQVSLQAARPVTPDMRACKEESTDDSCCQRLPLNLCPVDRDQESVGKPIVVECYCWGGDLCNKNRSYLDKELVRKFKKARPCEAQTATEHLLLQTRGGEHKKPNTSETIGFMCPVFYSFAQPGRPSKYLRLLSMNNFQFYNNQPEADESLFQEDGCHLIDVKIREMDYCGGQLFGDSESTDELLLILLCSVEGNPLGENRTSYPDAELKKTISANLTAAKAEFPTCKTDSLSMDFESVSELALDNSKLKRMYNERQTETNDNITTAHCFVEVSFVYRQQYNFTFGAVSIDNKSMLSLAPKGYCLTSAESGECVQLSSAADDERQHFACCCRRRWNHERDMCREVFTAQLKKLLWNSTIAETPGKIMSELKQDPLTKCDEPATTDELNRPCARNEGCYTGVHARDVPRTTQHKDYGGCVSEYAPDAKKRYDTKSHEIEARFYRICRLPRNEGECFAVLGTEDSELPDDVKGPQMVCCCGGHLGSAQKCGTSHKFGMKIGDFDL
ncbi:hypothetical protein AAVH_11010 [Aphelenchoides avenae]|nr:hypothetical protein AAVH_11010 [Aphelenchus avenae]